MSLEEYAEHTRQHIAELEALLAMGDGTMPSLRPDSPTTLDVALDLAELFSYAGGLGATVLKSLVRRAGSRALVPAVDAVYATATERIVAGYNVWGNAARVGSTYNVNVLGLYATESSQGLGALVGALRAEAAAAGASRISIQGLAIVNEGVAGISARAAARYGLRVERINANTIILTGGL